MRKDLRMESVTEKIPPRVCCGVRVKRRETARSLAPASTVQAEVGVRQELTASSAKKKARQTPPGARQCGRDDAARVAFGVRA